MRLAMKAANGPSAEDAAMIAKGYVKMYPLCGGGSPSWIKLPKKSVT